MKQANSGKNQIKLNVGSLNTQFSHYSLPSPTPQVQEKLHLLLLLAIVILSQ